MTHNHYKKKQKLVEPASYTQKNVKISDAPLFFIEGLEHFFLLAYFIFLPYLAGVIFLFIYIADRDIKIFTALNSTNSYLLTWTIGYEILAALALILIMKNAIMFSIRTARAGPSNRKFVIP